jgi:WD40 repeat protein
MNKQEIKDKQPPSINPKFAFGIRSDIKENIQFFASDKCAFPVGNYIVITTIKDKLQYFYPANPDFGEISCFSIDEYVNYIMLAIAQKGDKPRITLHFINKNDFVLDENKTKKLVLSDDLEPGDFFISIAVNLSKGYIIALMGPKVQSIIVWQHEYRSNNTKFHSFWKLALASTYKYISINPINPYFFTVYGDGGFAVCRFNDTEKKNPDKIEINSTTPNYQEFNLYILNFNSCTWVSKNRLVLLNTSCDVFVIDYGRKFETPLKKVIKGVHIFESQSKGKAIFQKGGNLYVTRDDGTIIKLEEKQQSEKIINYEKVQNATKFVQNLPRMEVHHLSINQLSNTNNSGIFISTETSQLYFIELINDNSLSDGNNFKHFICSFHSEEITCLDVSKIKQLVATCSKDKTIRIWNYLNMQLEVNQDFDEDATHISFHPNGLHLAVSFRESFKLMNILEKSIVAYKEFAIGGIRDVLINKINI